MPLQRKRDQLPPTPEPTEAPRKRSSVTRFMMPFRSSKPTSPRSSIDSTTSSLDVDYSQDEPSRRSSKTSRMEAAMTNSSLSSANSNKLRKSSTRPTETSDTWERDRVTGEVKDHTTMLHSLAHEFDAPTGGKQAIIESSESAQPPADFVSQLPAKIWLNIVSFLSIADEAIFYLASKSFQAFCSADITRCLNHPDNFRMRCEVLYRLNYLMPNHLLCYICGIYHSRIQAGKETLRPTNIANPVYICPYANSNDRSEKVSRHRITFGRALPYTFVQLVMREHHHGPAYGIHYDQLGRRYKDRPEVGNWSHQTRWAIIDDHLYMRVVSTCFAVPNLPPSGMRNLLYSREDFTPFFSVCAHWRDGVLMPVCKCALTHVPAPLEGSGVQRLATEAMQRLQKPQSQIVRQCETCKPLRRCPECPTEYLIEIRLSEDRTEKDTTKLFKQSIIVTRWSDLGDGSSPWSPEWASNQGDFDSLPKEKRFDSFAVLGRRAINGTFESFFNPEQIPPQRLTNLNPTGERLGEKGHNWY